MTALPFRRLRRLLVLCVPLGLVWLPLRAQKAEPQPTVIESDGRAEMVSTDKETTITFRDNVRVTGTELRLTCDYLEVVVERTGDLAATLGQLDKFRSLIATGSVRLIQQDREAACGRAEVLPGEDRIVLSEQPVVTLRDEKTRLAGEKITMLRGQRQVIVDKPTVVGPPVRDLGFDKEKKAASAEPSPVSPQP